MLLFQVRGTVDKDGGRGVVFFILAPHYFFFFFFVINFGWVFSGVVVEGLPCFKPPTLSLGETVYWVRPGVRERESSVRSLEGGEGGGLAR